MAVVSMVVVATGCGVASELRLGASSLPDDVVAEGVLTGTLGSTRHFDDSLRLLTIDDWDGGVQVQGHVLTPGGWAMVGITAELEGGLDALPVNQSLTPDDHSDIDLWLMGCSGPVFDVILYDEDPVDYTVTVREDPDSCERYLELDMDFGRGGHVSGVLPLPDRVHEGG